MFKIIIKFFATLNFIIMTYFPLKTKSRKHSFFSDSVVEVKLTDIIDKRISELSKSLILISKNLKTVVVEQSQRGKLLN